MKPLRVDLNQPKLLFDSHQWENPNSEKDYKALIKVVIQLFYSYYLIT